MSVRLHIDQLSFATRERLAKELCIAVQEKITPAMYYDKKKEIILTPYGIFGDYVHVPFHYAVKNENWLMECPTKLEGEKTQLRPLRSKFTTVDMIFEGELRPHQVEIKKEVVSLLNRGGSCVLAAYCGFGKSITAVSLACKIGLKVLIVVSRVILLEQWKLSIKRFCPQSGVQLLTPKSTMDPNAHFFLMNAINIEKMGEMFFRDIGVVIADECHLIATEVLSRSFQTLAPRYLIGLSATPFRPDGMDILLDLYFGANVNTIVRKLNRKHIAYRVNTGFVPEIQMMANGKMDWNVVLNSQALDMHRNELIVRIVCFFSNRTFLVLCKRVVQAKILSEMLSKKGIYTASLIQSETTFDENARVLVATTGKASTGFDHPKLDTLLMAADVQEYYIQYIGRVFRKEDTEPIVFDLVDNSTTMKAHYARRKKVYIDHGGNVVDFFKRFPEMEK